MKTFKQFLREMDHLELLAYIWAKQHYKMPTAEAKYLAQWLVHPDQGNLHDAAGAATADFLIDFYETTDPDFDGAKIMAARTRMGKVNLVSDFAFFSFQDYARRQGENI